MIWLLLFLGPPHRIDDRSSQLLKSLRSIGFEQYAQAEQKGWVLYLEGSTDLAILQAFAEKLDHPAQDILKRPYVHYVENQPRKAREHFYGLREAKTDLVGFCLLDRVESELQTNPEFREYQWKRREIENYIVCRKEILIDWAQAEAERRGEASQLVSTMDEAIAEIQNALETLGRGSPWSPDTKVSDDFLDPLFDSFFDKLGLENLMRKTNYHTLVQYVPPEQIDPEVSDVLDGILEIANLAKPIDDG